MKKSPLQKNINLLLVTLAVMILPLHTCAANPKTHNQSTIVKTKTREQAESKKRDALVEKRKEIIEEAVDAAKATQKALKALDNDQPKQALSALRVASGNLDLLLARDPDLGLIPIDVQAQVFETNADLAMIKRLEDDLEDLIDDHRYSEARTLLNSLADEIRITKVLLPMAVYPAAISESARLIDAGKMDEAKNSLYDALDTLVIMHEIIPLPVLRADALLTQAFQIEHKSDLSKKETRDKIEALVDGTRTELKIAQSLGYGEKDDYGDLYDGMDALKKSIGKSGFKGKWQEMKKSISSLKNRLVHPAH